jgi:lipopolysaccharide/colanic/teichoic acid biosynthesis glycosyltransferase
MGRVTDTIVYVVTVPQSLTLLRGQLKHMRSRGASAHVITSPGPEVGPFESREGVPVHAVDMQRRVTPLLDLLSTWEIWRLLRRLRPAVVNASTPKGGLLGMIAAWAAGVPARVYVMRGLPLVTARGPKRVLLRWTEKVSCALAHRVVCISPSLRDVAVAEQLCPTRKLTVVGAGSSNGVDAERRFNPDRLGRGARQAARSDAGIPHDALVLGFVGRVVRDKGIMELEAAWRRLSAEYPALRLLMVGTPEPGDPPPAEAWARLQGDGRVHRVGQVDDVARWYAAMDLLVFPTYREGFGNVAIEAAAMGLPVVATKIPGVIDAVADGATATLVPPGDADALAAAIRKYVNDPALRQAHGRAGRERVLRDFRPEAIWEGVYRQYRQLLTAYVARPDPAAAPVPQQARATTASAAPAHPVTVLQLLKTSVGATWALRQMRELVRLGVKVHAALPPGPLVPHYEAAGVVVHLMNADLPVVSIGEFLRRRRALRDLVDAVKPDLIHSHFVGTTLMMRLALGRRHPVPRLFQVPGPLHLEHTPFRWADLGSAGPRDHWMGSCVWTCNRYLASGVPRERLSLSYYGLDVGGFVPGARGKLRGELRLPPDARIVGMVAYMYAPKRFLGQTRGLKGHEDLIDAVALCIRDNPSLYCVMVGGAWNEAYAYERRVRAYARRRCGDRVIFLGTRGDIADLYADFDVVCHPSHSENVGGAAESLMLAVPTIASDVGGLPDLVKPGKTGWLVPPRDPRRLAAAIRDALARPDRAKQMACRGQALTRHVFDVRRCAADVLAAYTQILVENRKRRGTAGAVLKRTTDAVLAAGALVVLAPVMAAVALAVAATMGPPVLFRQTRAGWYGRPFELLKFRTMTGARDAAGNLLPDAQRLTRLGSLLRSTSLDELPQLWNVLRGDMSLVGPRPLLMEYLPLYSPAQARRLDAKPGLTGWAQVNGRNSLSWEQRFDLDAWYVGHRSFWLDVKILFLTARKVFVREGINQRGGVTMEPFRGSASAGAGSRVAEG